MCLWKFKLLHHACNFRCEVVSTLLQTLALDKAGELDDLDLAIIMLDGKVVIEARYMNVEIKDNGTACLTIIPGKTKTVKL